MAKSINFFGLNLLIAYVTASANTNLPSASVLITSIECPEEAITTSPGLCAFPEGIFSTKPTTAVT